MRNVEKMTIDELIKESVSQHEVASDAENRAKLCERTAIQKFLTENHLDKTILHKRTGTKGQLCLAYETKYKEYVVKFHSLKKNGEISGKAIIECEAWGVWKDLERNFADLLSEYEPCEELSDEKHFDILNEIIRLLSEQNRKQTELTDYLFLDKSTFSAWKSGKSESYKKYLPEISKFFSITIDELVNNCEENKITAIEKFRKMKGMTQYELADKLGVSASAISRYESGRRKPSIVQLKRLAQILGCTTDQLLNLEI